ncbi:hypothetical protein PPUJ20028_50280 [Pseudomonas putida]|uniref:Uncharacterized protein n=1 Tax=Pseudomonas putida TaxID=303 RepID=A0AA37RHV7_PSEPU|nr:hypothetical protein PPUJ20028_50280 [Pseudomonas putida]GLO38186.1 hypothetical protein PPUN14671_50230 [Pseudomonas putida]
MATVSIWKPLAVKTRASQKARKGRWWRSNCGAESDIGNQGPRRSRGVRSVSSVCNKQLLFARIGTFSRFMKEGGATGHAAINHTARRAIRDYAS